VLSGWSFGIIVGIVLFLSAYLWCLRVEKSYDYVTFTPRKRDRFGKYIEGEGKEEELVDFDPRHGHYLKCAEVVITLSSASLIFIPSVHLSSGVLPRFAFSLVLLGFTVLYGVLFMAFVTYFYEEFLYDPKRFTVYRSALLSALGFTALLCFGLSYGWLAIQLARLPPNSIIK